MNMTKFSFIKNTNTDMLHIVDNISNNSFCGHNILEKDKEIWKIWERNGYNEKDIDKALICINCKAAIPKFICNKFFYLDYLYPYHVINPFSGYVNTTACGRFISKENKPLTSTYNEICLGCYHAVKNDFIDRLITSYKEGLDLTGGVDKMDVHQLHFVYRNDVCICLIYGNFVISFNMKDLMSSSQIYWNSLNWKKVLDQLFEQENYSIHIGDQIKVGKIDTKTGNIEIIKKMEVKPDLEMTK